MKHEYEKLGETIPELMNHVVDLHGDKDALLIKPTIRYWRWSYQQLWDDASKASTYIKSKGLVKGDRVIIWGPNSPYWVITLLACLRMGIIVVPLDLRSPLDYVSKVILQTQPKIAFISRFTPDYEWQKDVSLVNLETYENQYISLNPTPTANVSPDDIAEIMFTSGTTGEPKGVILTHLNLVSNLIGTIERIKPNSNSRLMSVLPLSHMFEQMGGLFVALYYGSSITYATSRQPAALTKLLKERKITTLLIVPQGLELLMNSIFREAERKGKLKLLHLLFALSKPFPIFMRRMIFKSSVLAGLGGSIDLIISGGAALPRTLAEKWESIGIKIVQGYGATEASPSISTNSIKNRNLDSVGQPLFNIDVKLDESDEILVRGPSITPGYWNNPDVTKDSFQGEWYKTGDLGNIDANGDLYIKGRKKDMIVLSNGQNVYPEDIENVLNAQPEVESSVILGLTRNDSVVVHAVIITSNPSNASNVIEFANHNLAEHQKIRSFTIWEDEDFPRTHTLKIKKNIVAEQIENKNKENKPKSNPKSSPKGTKTIETLISEICEKDLSEINHDSTLGEDLGIDSLGRVEILSAIETDFGIYIDENEVKSTTTVGELNLMVKSGSTSPAQTNFSKWSRKTWAKFVRSAVQKLILIPFIKYCYKLTVIDTEKLKTINGPVIFTCNHALSMDNWLIIKAFPNKWRRTLAVAAADHLWKRPLFGIYGPLLGNGFPIAKSGPVRPSLENLSNILDEGWSILIYPEGELTVGGPMKPFLNGIGLLAKETRVPIIPMKLSINDFGNPTRIPVKSRGDVEIRFGDQLDLNPDASIEETTEAIQKAVETL
ncbi:MAG: hypothetical protein CL768_01405 [Chloroflexi bacterium]|nr:hypothetical protein [Chloroflexota bacterium]